MVDVPLGALIYWLKSLSKTPQTLLDEWIECNGQVIMDSSSVYNGVTIPNLSGFGSTTKRFIRGSTTSGTTGGTETHTHTVTKSNTNACGAGVSPILTLSVDAAGTLPSYYEAVPIMRIK
jgi:hypothetical protein